MYEFCALTLGSCRVAVFACTLGEATEVADRVLRDFRKPPVELYGMFGREVWLLQLVPHTTDLQDDDDLALSELRTVLEACEAANPALFAWIRRAVGLPYDPSAQQPADERLSFLELMEDALKVNRVVQDARRLQDAMREFEAMHPAKYTRN